MNATSISKPLVRAVSFATCFALLNLSACVADIDDVEGGQVDTELLDSGNEPANDEGSSDGTPPLIHTAEPINGTITVKSGN